MRKTIFTRGISMIVGISLLGACSEWQHDVTVKGIAFSKVKLNQDGLAIGVLKEETAIGGRFCQKGWVHVYLNGVPARFKAAQPTSFGGFKIPVDTWVSQNVDGAVTVCAFPRDTEVHSHLCRGSGGPTGVQTAFYASGALKQYFLRRDTTIQEIPCKAGVFHQSIELYENGHLKACVLSQDITRDGRRYPKGKRIHFGPDGRILP
jgi:hypothetical protein